MGYGPQIYISLVPLTVGVMLVCLTSRVTFDPLGFISSLVSTIIFVLQNIFSKKLFSNARHAAAASSSMSIANSPVVKGGEDILAPPKLDKLNLLFYSSLLSFTIMAPVWMYIEGYTLLTDSSKIPPAQVIIL